MDLGIREYYQIKDICYLEKGKQIDTDLLDASNLYKYINGGIDASGLYSEYNTTGQTITVSEGGASCGYVNYIEEPFWCGCHCYRLTDIKLNPKYVFYALKANQERIMKLRTGSAMPNIKKSSFECFQIGLSKNNLEQKYVVEILDKVYALIELKKGQMEKFDDLIRARFVEMFGDFKINSMKWSLTPLGDIAIIDCNMTTNFEDYADAPHIGIDSIEKNTGVLKGYRTVAEDGVISGKYVFTAQHVIYSKVRPNLNKVALPDFDGVCSADAYPILPIEGKCNRVFLAYDIRSKYFLDYILQFSNRTNLPKVNRKEVMGFKTPLPPLELQQQFAAFVAQADKSKVVIQKSLDEVQLLLDSLMQKYFG